jgi:hypothetical protein
VSSVRTSLRDIVVDLLRARSLSRKDGEAFDVALNFLAPEECKRAATVCVVVTDEQVESLSLQGVKCIGSLTIVIYVKDDRDARSMLDEMIETVYESMLSSRNAAQGLGVFQLSLASISTDEATTSVNPFAQAVMKYAFSHSRPAVLS